MAERPKHSTSIDQFVDFINTQLDMSGLEGTQRLSEREIDERIMPLIREDIERETLKVVEALLSEENGDGWRAQIAPFHREVQRTLAAQIAGVMANRHPERMSEDEWLEAAQLMIALAWLVRKRIDSAD